IDHETIAIYLYTCLASDSSCECAICLGFYYRRICDPRVKSARCCHDVDPFRSSHQFKQAEQPVCDSDDSQGQLLWRDNERRKLSSRSKPEIRLFRRYDQCLRG